MSSISIGLLNDYTLRPKSIANYNSFRGVTDFSQIGNFNQYESGYQFLFVIQMPKFMEVLANSDAPQAGYLANLNEAFKHMLECEFRGLEGLPDIQADTFSITDGINEVRMINKVTEDTSATVSMSYFEKQGSLIEKFSEIYLTGIKDLKTQAKTYHGLIREGKLDPSLENEVFTLLFVATDNTMLRIERAVLLCNAQLTKAEASQYNGSRSDINNREVTVEFNCFPVRGSQVDAAAYTLLADVTGVNVANVDTMTGNTTSNEQGADSNLKKYMGTGAESSESEKYIYLDSTDFKYEALRPRYADNILTRSYKKVNPGADV